MDPALSAWQNFYVIVGPSGAALIGVQFVVIALIANTRKCADGESIDAFGTLTVVHFGGALSSRRRQLWYGIQSLPSSARPSVAQRQVSPPDIPIGLNYRTFLLGRT